MFHPNREEWGSFILKEENQRKFTNGVRAARMGLFALFVHVSVKKKVKMKVASRLHTKDFTSNPYGQR